MIMSIFVFLVPYAYHIDLGPGPDSLVAMLWDLRFDTPVPFYIVLRTLEIFFEYNFVRILFLIVFFIFLSGKLHEKFVIIAGFITELAILIISLPRFYILNPQGDNLFPILIPIPTLLVINILVVFMLKKVKNKE
jgi:hypothetical protein